MTIVLVPTDTHKHLGVVLQNDCKWDAHVKSVLSKCRPLISCLKTFKYRLSRKALESIYKSYVLPHFDYADVLWDNCTQEQAQNLENLHLDALRTIIGTVRGTSHQKLYTESGFTTLAERRKRHKIIMYHKIATGQVPNYLFAVLPPLVADINPYHLRRPLDRDTLAWDLVRFKTSFFPTVTNIWNSLPVHIQENQSLSQVKHFLTRDDPIVPQIYFIGTRLEQVMHCKLRLGMSDLNKDKVNRHISDNPMCACGVGPETARHYLLLCTQYDQLRMQTINTLPRNHQTVKTLLNGNPRISQMENSNIMKVVLQYITGSQRFKFRLNLWSLFEGNPLLPCVLISKVYLTYHCTIVLCWAYEMYNM